LENWEISDGNRPGLLKNCCPCEVVFYMNVPYLRLEGFTITEDNMHRFGFVDIEFSPQIDQPDEVTFAEPDEDEIGEVMMEESQLDDIPVEEVIENQESNMKTTTLPPTEIYNVLHDAESKGIELPESVEEWWAIETDINNNPNCQKCKDHYGSEKPECDLCMELDSMIQAQKDEDDEE